MNPRSKHALGPGLVLATAATLFGCAPAVHVESSPSPRVEITPGQTYSWRSGSGGVDGDPRTENNSMLDEQIKSVIDEEMQLRGFRRAPEGNADLGLAYIAAVEHKIQVDEVNDILHYRRGSYFVSRTQVDEYDLGTLILDFSDPASGDLLWRGSAQAELHRSDREYRAAKLRSGVRGLLDELTPDAQEGN